MTPDQQRRDIDRRLDALLAVVAAAPDTADLTSVVAELEIITARLDRLDVVEAGFKNH